MLSTENFWVIKKLISWLYVKVVFLPEFKKKMEKQYPHAKITYDIQNEEVVMRDADWNHRLMRQAWFERERIPNDHLH